MQETEIVKQAAESGVLWKFLGWLWTGVVTIGSVLVGIIWKKHNEEIDSIKNRINWVGDEVREGMEAVNDRISKIEREYTPMEVHETARKEMRDGIIDLHRKVETNAASLLAKVDAASAEASRRHNELLQILLTRKD